MLRVTKNKRAVQKTLVQFHLIILSIFILSSCSPESRQLSAQPTKAMVPKVTYRPSPQQTENNQNASPVGRQLNPPLENSNTPTNNPEIAVPDSKKRPNRTTPEVSKSTSIEKVKNPGSQTPERKSLPLPPRGAAYPVKATVYFTPAFKLKNRYCHNSDLKRIYDSKYNILGELCPKDFDSCVMEGACHIERQGGFITVNFLKRDASKAPIFFVVDTSRCAAGMGVLRSCLDPFYTVAADLRVHKPGEVIYISEVRGLPLPDGSRHTGYFIVRDTGAHRFITGKGRFDFFTDNISPFNKNFEILKFFRGEKGYPMHFVSVGMISPELANQVKKARNYPLTP